MNIDFGKSKTYKSLKKLSPLLVILFRQAELKLDDVISES